MSVLVESVDLGPGVGAWFTGRDPQAPAPPVGRAGNLSHRRPHQPGRLAADRIEALERMGLQPGQLHLMRQVHGAKVGVVAPSAPPGLELDGVDALVTAVTDRPLAVQVADCLPVLLAGPRAAAVVHAGRKGVAADVTGAAVRRLADLGQPVEGLRAVIGPAIGGCCYEVPEAMRDELGARHPAAVAETTWGTPSLDLPAAVDARLRALGVAEVARFGGCTRCDPDERWFSHRGDPGAGRQLGVVVRRAA